MTLNRTTLLIVLLISIVFVLYIGKDLFIPLVLASLVWFLVKDLRNFIQKTPFIGKKLPRWFLNLLAVGILYASLGLIVHLLSNNITQLSKNMTLYSSNLEAYNTLINAQFGVDIKELWSANAGDFDFGLILDDFLKSLSSVVGNVFMIALYLLFMLLEESTFNQKVLSIYTSQQKKQEMITTMNRINDSISKYISLKTLVSVITATLSYIILKIVGLDAPMFWAFLIFLLNFIPTIGSLIGTLLPTAMALLQFTDPTNAIIVLVAVGTIQVVVGNIIEPRIMGNSLNVSSFVVILALSFWGAIWGITGMVLSVPITVILVILFGQFEATRAAAILLSDKGKIDA